MRLGALLLLLQLPAGDTQSCDDFEDDNGDLWDLSSLVGLRTASGPAPTGTGAGAAMGGAVSTPLCPPFCARAGAGVSANAVTVTAAIAIAPKIRRMIPSTQ